MPTDDETIRLILDMGASGATVADVQQKLESLGQAAEKTGNKMAGVGQATLQTGRIIQDFAQGGIPGILNNIEGLTRALGGGMGLAGVMTAVGVAAYFFMPKLKEWFGVVEDGKDKAKEAAQEMAEFHKQVEAVHKAFQELAQAPSGGEADVARRLTEYLRERPHAEQARAGLLAGMTTADALRIMRPAQQQEYERLTAQGAMTDEEIVEQIRRTTGHHGSVIADRMLREAQDRRSAARTGAARMLEEAREGRAEGLIQQAQIGGPAGEEGRRRLAQLGPEFAQPPMTREEQEKLEIQGRKNARAYEREEIRRREVQEQERAAAVHDVGKRIEHDTEHKNRELEARTRDQNDRQRDFQREQAQQAAELERQMMAAADPEQTRQQRQLGQARRAVTGMAREYSGGTWQPTADQTDAMARETIEGLRDGLNAAEATFNAVLGQVQRMRAQSEEFRGRMQMMQQQAGMAGVGRPSMMTSGLPY